MLFINILYKMDQYDYIEYLFNECNNEEKDVYSIIEDEEYDLEDINLSTQYDEYNYYSDSEYEYDKSEENSISDTDTQYYKSNNYKCDVYSSSSEIPIYVHQCIFKKRYYDIISDDVYFSKKRIIGKELKPSWIKNKIELKHLYKQR